MIKFYQTDSRTLQQDGYSLLELLVVLGILATISMIAIQNYIGTNEQANDRLVRTEMQGIAGAIRQFKQDTGYYPKTGPFALAAHSGNVTNPCLPDFIGGAAAGLTTAEKERWFYSPANLYQLIATRSPLDDDNDPDTSSHQLENWDTETGRGWRGPYLDGFIDGYVDIKDKINSSGSADGDVTESPLEGISIPDVIGIADPFGHRHKSILNWSRHRRRLASESSALPDREDIEKWGRPYLLFGLNSAPVLISMGPNGDFNNGEYDPSNDKDDISLQIK